MFCLCIKYGNFEEQRSRDNGVGYVDPHFVTYPILAICAILLYHEFLQQLGIMERVGGFFHMNYEKMYVSNVLDITSQIIVGYSAMALQFHFYDVDNPGERERENFLIVLAVVSLLLMGKTFVYLSGYKEVGWLVMVLITTTYDMRAFLLVCGLIIYFFSGAFEMLTANVYILDDDCEGDDCGIDDDTLMDFQGYPLLSYSRVFTMGMIGEFSYKGFAKTSNEAMMIIVYILLIFMLQIVALNALIALLGDSFNKVNQTKTAALNVMLAGLMVEYMDCWEGIITSTVVKRDVSLALKKREDYTDLKNPIFGFLMRCWLFFTNGTLLELEMKGLWTHKLKVSDEHIEPANIQNEILSNQREAKESLKNIKEREFVVAKRDRDKMENMVTKLISKVSTATQKIEQLKIDIEETSGIQTQARKDRRTSVAQIDRSLSPQPSSQH